MLGRCSSPAGSSGPLGDVTISTLRSDGPGGLRGLAILLERHDEQWASELYLRAADAGDADAMAALVGHLRRAGDRRGGGALGDAADRDRRLAGRQGGS